jgi:hypothetical protein
VNDAESGLMLIRSHEPIRSYLPVSRAVPRACRTQPGPGTELFAYMAGGPQILSVRFSRPNSAVTAPE